MANPLISIQTPSKYHRVVEHLCHASVWGDFRWRQCSRKAVTVGHIHYGLPSLADGPTVPLCRAHANCSNVVEDVRA